MPEQILLQGKILGIEQFLLSDSGASGEELLAGRCQWITLLSEVLPRALLVEFGLARILLGSSGGGQFLLVLPGEARARAEDFLKTAARDISQLSRGNLKLVWGVTENLGNWSDIRKRLNEELQRKRGTPLAEAGQTAFEPHSPQDSAAIDPYFCEELGRHVREASVAGWSPEEPAKVHLGSGKHTWNLTPNLSLDGITIARHGAPNDDGTSAARAETLARRAQGRAVWGVLRGDVDSFNIRLRRLHTIEEHVQVSVLYKQFFAGELEVLCSLPEFWRKVTILYAGGDDFAVYGAWDALIPLARELQRVFHRFTEENLKEFPGAEGKTISMALALAPDLHATMHAVYHEAGRNLEIAKSADKDCIYVLGRILEWKQLSDAAELKETVNRLLAEFRSSHQFLVELRSFYEKQNRMDSTAGEAVTPQATWRFQRRFNRILSGTREREFEKLRTHLIHETVGRKLKADTGKPVKLRPAGLVALEWARLSTEVQ